MQARAQPDSRDERESLAGLVESSRARAWVSRCGGRVILVKAGAAHSAWLLGVPMRAVADASDARSLRSARGILIVGGPSPIVESLSQTGSRAGAPCAAAGCLGKVVDLRAGLRLGPGGGWARA